MHSIQIPLDRLPSNSAANRGKRVGMTTMGCKVNTFESELIAQALRTREWEVVDAGEYADLYIINTCTVTREADRQARQLVRRMIRRNPDALVIMTGCYAQMDPQACAGIPGVDLVLGNDRKLDLHEVLPELQRGELPGVMVGDLSQHVSLPDQLLTEFTGRSRAFVQIQQGCDQGCTFCIIHRARGPSRSLRPGMIIRQVERLVMNGYREVVICGVDVGSYGLDLPDLSGGYGLPQLLERILAVPGDFRVRLSSVDPAHISDPLIDLLRGHPKLCPQLHVSIQSGDSMILKRMKRRYTAEVLYERLGLLRKHMPDLVLSADVMVGFPTETERHFANTEALIRDFGIAYPHVFCYSERGGTPAARIPPHKQVPPGVRKTRARTLRALGARIRDAVLATRVGSAQRILLEGGGTPSPPAGYERGRAADYLPVWVPADARGIGEWINVVIEGVRGDTLIARLAA